jgi:hypothetical protein
MIQYSEFSNGNFVIHHVKLDGHEGWFSAWFDECGNLIDAEQRCNNGICRNATTIQRNVLAMAGRRYVKDPMRDDGAMRSWELSYCGE